MLIKKPDDIKAAEITSKELYLNRRQFIASALGAGADLLVIGRPMTGAPDPDAALTRILAEIETAAGA